MGNCTFELNVLVMDAVKIVLALILLLTGSCKEEKKYHDEKPVAAMVNGQEEIGDILQFQESLNEEFADPESSPLPDRYRMDFDGLDFFNIDTRYRVKAVLHRTPDAVPFLMPTSTNRKSEEVVYGIVHFQLAGKEYRLEVYQNQELRLQQGYEDYLFLPFTDLTNGTETYSGGRYIDLSIPQGDSLIIDFNKAYNPYCAYNKKYSCPLVPRVNHIPISIPAGVRAFDPK